MCWPFLLRLIMHGTNIKLAHLLVSHAYVKTCFRALSLEYDRQRDRQCGKHVKFCFRTFIVQIDRLRTRHLKMCFTALSLQYVRHCISASNMGGERN
jgi:hypothetical protein